MTDLATKVSGNEVSKQLYSFTKSLDSLSEPLDSFTEQLDLFSVFLTWIFSVRKTRLNKEYLIALIEKNTTLTYMHEKKSSIGKKLNPCKYNNHEYTLS